MKQFRSAEWWTLISQWSKFHFLIFLLPNLKVLFQYTNVFLCAKFGDLKPMINETQRPQIWTCFWARCRNKIPQGNCDFISTKCFINVNQSSWSTDCAALQRQKTWNLKLCFWTNVGTKQAKIEKISISLAIQIEFVRFLVSAIR